MKKAPVGTNRPTVGRANTEPLAPSISAAVSHQARCCLQFLCSMYSVTCCGQTDCTIKAAVTAELQALEQGSVAIHLKYVVYQAALSVC